MNINGKINKHAILGEAGIMLDYSGRKEFTMKFLEVSEKFSGYRGGGEVMETMQNVKTKEKVDEEVDKKLIGALLAPLVGLVSLLESGKETSNGWAITHPVLAAAGIIIIVGSIAGMLFYAFRRTH